MPEKYWSPVSTTRAALGARTGVPAPDRKSVPLCGLRGCPLNTLRRPEAARRGAGHRLAEAAAPEPLRARPGEDRRHLRRLALDARQHVGGRIDVAGGDPQPAGRKLLRLHGQRVGRARPPAAGPGRLHRHRDVARLHGEIDADQAAPHVAVVGREQPDRLAEDGRARRRAALRHPHLEDHDLPRMEGPRAVRHGEREVFPGCSRGRNHRRGGGQEQHHDGGARPFSHGVVSSPGRGSRSRAGRRGDPAGRGGHRGCPAGAEAVTRCTICPT